MSQFKDHPFVQLMNAIFPVILPNFYLRSVRDRENMPEQYPLIDYVIIRGGRETLERPKNTFRAEIDVQIDILVKETSPLSWCKFDFLEEAQSRQALYHYFQNKIREFIKLAVNPTRLDPTNIKQCDVLYKDYDWRFIQTIGTAHHKQVDKGKLTGISAAMQFSYIPQDDDVCCLIDGTAEQWEKIQQMVVQDSTSWKLIQNIIDSL